MGGRERSSSCPIGFDGVAVTPSGRVWSSRTRELRQAPAVGEERVLAERNRRDALVRASEAAVQAELAAGAALERRGEAVGARRGRVRATRSPRTAPRLTQRDEASEEERRIAAAIERRRAAPDDGPDAGRRMQLSAELAAARGAREREQRERAERQARIERLRRRDAARRGAAARASAP